MIIVSLYMSLDGLDYIKKMTPVVHFKFFIDQQISQGLFYKPL